MINNLPVPNTLEVSGVLYFCIDDDLRIVCAHSENSDPAVEGRTIIAGVGETLERFTTQAGLTDLRKVVLRASLPVEGALLQEHVYPVAANLIQAWWYEVMKLPMPPKVEKNLLTAIEAYEKLIKKARKNPKKFIAEAHDRVEKAIKSKGGRKVAGGQIYSLADKSSSAKMKGQKLVVWTAMKKLGSVPSADIVTEVEIRFRAGDFESKSKSLKNNILWYINHLVKEKQAYIVGATKPLPGTPAKVKPVKPAK